MRRATGAAKINPGSGRNWGLKWSGSVPGCSRVPAAAWVDFSLQPPALSPAAEFNSAGTPSSHLPPGCESSTGGKAHPTLQENRRKTSFWPKMRGWRGELTLPSGARATRSSLGGGGGKQALGFTTANRSSAGGGKTARQTKCKRKGCLLSSARIWGCRWLGPPSAAARGGRGSGGQHRCNPLTPDNANKPHHKGRRGGNKGVIYCPSLTGSPLPSTAAAPLPGPHHPSSPYVCKVSSPPPLTPRHAPQNTSGRPTGLGRWFWGAYLWPGSDPPPPLPVLRPPLPHAPGERLPLGHWSRWLFIPPPSDCSRRRLPEGKGGRAGRREGPFQVPNKR